MHFHQQKIKPRIVEYLRGIVEVVERIRHPFVLPPHNKE